MNLGELDPAVQVAIVSAFSGLAVALVGGMVTIITLLVQTKRHARSADTQVSNNHVDENGKPINLREESDGRHAETIDALNEIRGDMRGMRRDIGRIDHRSVQLADIIIAQGGRLAAIERTEQEDAIRELRQQLREKRTEGIEGTNVTDTIDEGGR